MMQAFASCPKHLELLLKDELIACGCQDVREKLAGVSFTANAEQLMRVLMWSRLANRILVHVLETQIRNQKDLYNAIAGVDWLAITKTPAESVLIRFQGTTAQLKNTLFSSQVCKDAICDQYQQAGHLRPNVEKSDAQLNVFARLKHKELNVYLDIGGRSLHQRGYRIDRTTAPLRENLAAALLMRADWPEYSQQGYNLIDPMCGSGTILTEGWMMACDIAPNKDLNSPALMAWQAFDDTTWSNLQSEADNRKEQGMAAFRGQIIGVDHHQKSIDKALQNIKRLGANKNIQCQVQTLDKFRIPPRKNLVVCNPPYGVRLQKNSLQSWYALAHWLSRHAMGSEAAVVTPDASKGYMLGFRVHKAWSFMNGALDIQLRQFHVRKDQQLEAHEDQYFALPAAAQMLANRLKKNKKERQSWIQEQSIEAWRLYDAELPEFAVAIDVYQDYIHLQEYQAPKSIPEKKARQRLSLAILAVQAVMQPNANKISVKTRQKQKGSSQYNALDQQGQEQHIKEQGRLYQVDLFRYLDTGLFLDHRWLRNHIESISKGKTVLNLFAYTGSIGVAAAIGGAQQTINVDTSKTYLKWAEDNYRLNQIGSSRYQMIRADGMEHVQNSEGSFDIIVVDPPTFSNSHSRTRDWDVQRDHTELLTACARLLKPDGVLFFSNNYRKFSLDENLQKQFTIKDISRESLDMDFRSSQKIHWCYEMQLNNEE
ncbi:bifunctional 23S rRNA (guanine(2069)-N(7))-methyltransferase RlmK/23S rRNA (guanine(2445)-N(2))-methyltransferase RlmL [Marinicella sp. W31]|uniref:bifunctional 23S rRNA (guanine(2069)-N(7))-methyltransferase RlmK/23S rRNA (guanine(2445)-N(2))-methyltransferase RlmL n=1 Tax=Marinicella sp. W31 TaxID=3023713 RepID=UPI0037565104